MKPIFFMLISVLLIGCRKDSASLDKNKGTPKVKTSINNDTAGTSANYQYDGMGRVVRYQSEGLRTDFKYSTGAVNVKIYDTAGFQISEMKFNLNNEGLVVNSYVIPGFLEARHMSMMLKNEILGIILLPRMEHVLKEIIFLVHPVCLTVIPPNHLMSPET